MSKTYGTDKEKEIAFKGKVYCPKVLILKRANFQTCNEEMP
jgi:hypothetical protein